MFVDAPDASRFRILLQGRAWELDAEGMLGPEVAHTTFRGFSSKEITFGCMRLLSSAIVRLPLFDFVRAVLDADGGFLDVKLGF
jgi:hypothetical protein